MTLSQTHIYALQACLLLAQSRHHAPVPCSQLARDGKMPERFLLQILTRLVKGGLLSSSCGVAGGYVLARAAGRVSLVDILDAIDREGPSRKQEIDFVSPRAKELVAKALRSAELAARTELQSLTLADLLDSKGVEPVLRALELPNSQGSVGHSFAE